MVPPEVLRGHDDRRADHLHRHVLQHPGVAPAQELAAGVPGPQDQADPHRVLVRGVVLQQPDQRRPRRVPAELHRLLPRVVARLHGGRVRVGGGLGLREPRQDALEASALGGAVAGREPEHLHEAQEVTPHHETFSSTIQPPYSSTKG